MKQHKVHFMNNKETSMNAKKKRNPNTSGGKNQEKYLVIIVFCHPNIKNDSKEDLCHIHYG